jgi:hypothetical protein
MRLLFAHFADYGALDSKGKLIVAGIFEVVYDTGVLKPIPFPSCYFVAKLEASLSDGYRHRVGFRLVDADNHPLENTQMQEGDVEFKSSGPGYPLTLQFLVNLPPGGIAVPDFGDYGLDVVVDGNSLGVATFSVRPFDPPLA